MSIVSKNKALTLASTAVVLFCGNIVSAGSEPLFNIDVSDKAAISFSNGVNESYAYTSDYKIRASTTGSTKRAWGILVSKSLTAPTIFGFDGSQGGSLSIFTEGDKAHGAQVGAKGSNADGNDKSVLTLGGRVSVSTIGVDSYGLHAIDGGTINSEASISTRGKNGFGAFAESYSTINQTGGSIKTTGQNGHALLANNDLNTVGGKIVATDTDIETSGDWAHGAFADNGGDITLNGGTVTTLGARAFGILASKNSTVTSSAAITTKGDKAHGVQAGANGSTADGSDESVITLTEGASVSTKGSDAYGLHAIDGGVINSSADVNTSGKNGFGAFAESFSEINQTGGKISTQGASGHGLVANNDRNLQGGKIVTHDTEIVTSGAWAYGAFADNGGNIELNGGSVDTSGDRSFGLLAAKNSTLTSNSKVTTSGAKAHGVQAGANGGSANGNDHSVITLKEGSEVVTSGSDAFGLHAIDGGKIAGTVSVSTSGANGFGAFAESNSTINLIDSEIVTNGADGYGLIANNDRGTVAGVVSATNTNVVTNGKFASGVFVKDGGSVNLSGGSVAANGTDAAALEINGTGTISVEGTVLKSAQGPSILVGFSASDDIANVSFGAGTVSTANNGVLTQVNRSGNGADGTFNLTLKAGSEASGDIVDLDEKGSGATHVKIEENAKFNGKISGITNLNTEAGTQLSFAEGTDIEGNVIGTGTQLTFHSTGATIGGDVELNNGSVTRGGAIGTPIIVGGSVVVDQTSFMGGNWSIGGNLTANGTLRPGNSIGIMTVGGDVTFGADSVYEVEIAGNGTSDRIDASGKATLNGGRVDVYALDDKISYQDGQTYTILTADGGVSGAFSEAVSKSVFLTTSLGYQANQVDLTVGLVTEPVDPGTPPVVFEKVAQTSNQKSTARALDSLEQSGSSLELYNSVLFLASEDEARNAFNQLSGDTHASVKTGLIDTANLTADAINNRLRTAFAGVAAKDTPVLSFAQSPKGSAPQPFEAVAPSTYDFGVWASGFGSWVDHDGNSNAGGLKSTTGGFLSGVDVGFASGWRLGIVGGYSQTDLDAKGRFASATSDNWHLGVYGGNQWGPIGLRAGLVQTWHNIDSSRSVAYTGFSDSLDADYDARTFQAFGELGYRIDTAVASFEPFANLSHIRLRTDGFTEKGGAAALSVDGETTNTTFTTLGLRASTPLQLGTSNANLKGTLGWRHAYGDITPESTQFFAGSNAFTVEGAPIAKDAALVEVGFDMAITEASTFGVSYVGQFGSGSTQNGFNASLNMKF
ncbi:autotransporter domain-containing protein [Ochrobactrum sp. CGA5]|uniref:autotransporter domain-containing protein n=1 Tax=Ochrobactrum sp. CGA5 TaxID=2583453 RepID=UPI00111D32A5|nr:autotransporter domain-containing protein [Ochrobactrum sp. CGA5]